ncbi:sepB protein [Uncinocarpus reesii 1704]|uniref:SepB protein n=1 Tax=Uncinocarpus reesii (strain UAMH 1704) TaxID=336963 RepID=C4JPZ6_UNCRE|nr:sepB protein [Uncinocarpus reesii 1704]EEP78383.1 sepB protein [Uncinocarpus reesii 1704]
MGAEDGTVWQYGLPDGQMDKMLVRCSLPVRDLAISKDKDWIAVASDDLTVKIVNIEDMSHVKYLRDQTKGVKHVTFDPSGRYVTASCSDGVIYVYSFIETEPTLVKKIDGVIQRLETEDEGTSQAAWHPDGTAFAAVGATKDIVVVSSRDWTTQKKFANGHTADITALAWSPNGALLASAGADGYIVLWETRTQNILRKYEFSNVINLAWHPVDNELSFTTSDGELYIYANFVPSEYQRLLEKILEVAPLLSTGVDVTTTLPNRIISNGTNGAHSGRQIRQGTPDSLDDILGPMDEDDDFVEDDDGAGYTEGVNAYGKRTNDHLANPYGHDGKRRIGASWRPHKQEAFQPGSTPWRGGRRYLCLNLVGFVWSVNQETHNTVTVEFYDREQYRDFHFTDPFLYDKACLNEKGTLFACQPLDKNPAVIFYRPHEMWTTRADWRTELPEGEHITGGDGITKLTYSIENVRKDQICQNEDTVALTEGLELRSVFFSDQGDPCIYDSSGVLLVLQHWRKPGQARWVPLLDTKQLDRVASGKKQETYWPVAVADDAFHCIILKGGDRYPYFPRPLLTQFEFNIPISSTRKAPANDEDGDADMDGSTGRDASRKLQESYVRTSLESSLLEDCIEAEEATSLQSTEQRRKDIEVDKIILQMLAVECREGEEKGMKAYELVTLLGDRTGKMLEAASKIAQRYDRSILDERIRKLAEKRLMGEDDNDDLA